MSSYVLGDSWPIRPTFFRYMKESTYRHDYNRSQAHDDLRLPANQMRRYDDPRQDGPYTDRGAVNNPYNDWGRYGDHRHLDYWRNDRDDRNSPIDRGYDRRYDNGPQTDRGGYRYTEDPYIDKRFRGPDNRDVERYQEQARNIGNEDRSRYQEPSRYNEPPRQKYEDGPMYDRRYNDSPRQNYTDAPQYDRYKRTTQKDYGDFKSIPRNPTDRPHAYRGEIDKEIDAFHNKDNDLKKTNNSDDQQKIDIDEYIDDVYLRPEEKQVRHRNMEYPYDAQLRLPMNIAPPTDYKAIIQKPTQSESGAYLFIRAHKDALSDIRKSFQKHKSILKMSGTLKGVALPDKVSVMGELENWNVKAPVFKQGKVFYDQSGRSTNDEYKTDYNILCLWFPSCSVAKNWIDYDVDFKLRSFPDPYGVELLSVPINYVPQNDIDCNTYLLTEYPEVRNKEAFQKYVKEPLEDILVTDPKYKESDPFVVYTDRVSIERGMMVNPRSLVTLHKFKSVDQAREFYTDSRVERIRRSLRDFTRRGASTSVLFQLVDFI